MTPDASESNPRNRQSLTIGWFVIFLQHICRQGAWYERTYCEHIIIAHRLMLES